MGMHLIKLADFRDQIAPTSQKLTNFRTKVLGQMVMPQSLTCTGQRILFAHFIRHLGLCIRSDCSTHCTYKYCKTKEFDSLLGIDVLFTNLAIFIV